MVGCQVKYSSWLSGQNEQALNCQHNLNNKVLYDFTDIESYDPEGLVNYMELIATDNCDYDSDDNGSASSLLEGGWNEDFTICDGFSTILGSLTITNGCLMIKNIILQSQRLVMMR